MKNVVYIIYKPNISMYYTVKSGVVRHFIAKEEPQVNLPKIDNSNLWDKTYNILKDQIIRRTFRPNEKLSIPALAEQLGVSRTPIREAIYRLEMEGLVKTVSKVGTFVSAIDESSMLDIMDTRLMLENWVIENLPKLSRQEIDEALARMEKILQHTFDAMQQSAFDSHQHADSNLAFHLEFMKMGKNRNNIVIYRNLMNYRYLAAKSDLISKEMVESAHKQHYAIIDAVRSGDNETMRNVIYTHLNDSKLKIIDRIKRNGGSI